MTGLRSINIHQDGCEGIDRGANDRTDVLSTRSRQWVTRLHEQMAGKPDVIVRILRPEAPYAQGASDVSNPGQYGKENTAGRRERAQHGALC